MLQINVATEVIAVNNYSNYKYLALVYKTNGLYAHNCLLYSFSSKVYVALGVTIDKVCNTQTAEHNDFSDVMLSY